MAKTLIVKLNATGDVVRTTSLLHRLEGHITWITARGNLPLLQGVQTDLRCLAWDERDEAADRHYDLVINLEDEVETAAFVRTISADRLFGAFLGSDHELRYTDDARGWFDLSLISRFGKETADQLKLQNRRTYQDLVFEGLGLKFTGERYVLPDPQGSDLVGDVAIAPAAGPVWPMKNWAFYEELKQELESSGLQVNVLPHRQSLLEHIGDVRNHRCLVGGDSLPMHIALGVGVPCVTIFNCTSPWEIFDYGLQTKIVSPLLGEFFYRRGLDPRATSAIGLQEVLCAVMDKLSGERWLLAPCSDHVRQ
jgi:ADP-heptose:LPS heptosyltransferase